MIYDCEIKHVTASKPQTAPAAEVTLLAWALNGSEVTWDIGVAVFDSLMMLLRSTPAVTTACVQPGALSVTVTVACPCCDFSR